MGKSERRSSAHMFWWDVCFLLMKNNLKHKRKPVGKKRVCIGWLFLSLKKEFEPLLSALICKRKRKQVLVLLHARMQKKLENKQGKLSNFIPNVIMHGLQPKV